MRINSYLTRNGLINFEETDPAIGADSQSDPGTQQQPPANTDSGVPQYLVVLNQANHARMEAEQENARLRAQLAARDNPPTPIPSLEPGDAFNNPQKLMQGIEALIRQQVAPLQAEVLQAKKSREYTELKGRLRQFYPQFVPMFLQIEPLVDQLMANQEPTEPNLIRAIETAVGRVAITNPQAFSNPNPPQNNQQPPQNNQQPPQNSQTPVNQNMLPPHLRPNNSTPMPTPRTPVVEYDENERRLIRESGMSVEDWEALKNCPPNQLQTKYRELQAKRKTGGQ